MAGAGTRSLGRLAIVAGTVTGSGLPGLWLRVHRLADLLNRSGQVVVCGLDRGGIVCGNGVTNRLDLGLDVGAHVGRNLLARVAERLLGLVCEVLRTVSQVHSLGSLSSLVRVGLGLLDHPLHLILVERGGTGDGDLVLLARAAILRGYMKD